MNQQELNARIEREVFYKNQPQTIEFRRGMSIPFPPDYSGSIAGAWPVVEELQTRGIVLECLSYLRKAWYCNFEQDTPRVWGMVRGQKTPAIAICLAALEICAKLRTSAPTP